MDEKIILTELTPFDDDLLTEYGFQAWEDYSIEQTAIGLKNGTSYSVVCQTNSHELYLRGNTLMYDFYYDETENKICKIIKEQYLKLQPKGKDQLAEVKPHRSWCTKLYTACVRYLTIDKYETLVGNREVLVTPMLRESMIDYEYKEYYPYIKHGDKYYFLVNVVKRNPYKDPIHGTDILYEYVREEYRCIFD